MHGLGGYLNNSYFRAVWLVRVEPFGRAFDHFVIKRAAKGNFAVSGCLRPCNAWLKS